jgi:hypothetical protein
MATTPLSTFLRHLAREMAAASVRDSTDQQLVGEALAGRDEVAFEAIVRRHGAMVYRIKASNNCVAPPQARTATWVTSGR